MSSTIFAVCGSSSLTHAPDWPCCANLKIEGRPGSVFWPDVMPVIRWPMRTLAGSSVPCSLFELRLVVEQIHLRWAARLVEEDDALRLRREVRQPCSPRCAPFSSEASASQRTRGIAGGQSVCQYYSFVMVSSRLRIALATTVQAASSGRFRCVSGFRAPDGEQFLRAVGLVA